VSDNIVLISPGSMLLAAREKCSLTQADIAKRLNLRPQLIANLEQDIFDTKLPATFNRGYLVSYAKVVLVDVDAILVSYDSFGGASAHRSEMHSFSKQTVKAAEQSLVMRLSYLILIVVVGLTALWWQQNTSVIVIPEVKSPFSHHDSQAENLAPVSAVPEKIASDVFVEAVVEKNIALAPFDVNEAIEPATEELKDNELIATLAEELQRAEPLASVAVTASSTQVKPAEVPLIERAVFTFSGDCWVNIYDANGERIAWGIKKSGYVMNIEGITPFSVTLGKPELASIVFNEQLVDMSIFVQGNIAKFTLPLTR